MGLILRRTNSSDYIKRLASVCDDVCEWSTKVRNFRFVLVKHFETAFRSRYYRLELLIDFVGARECCLTFVGSVRSLCKLCLSSRQDFFGSVMLNCETCYPRADFSKIGLVARWRAWLLIIHRKRTKDFAAAGKNRRRPTGAKPVCQSQFPIIVPKRINSNICHNNGFAAIHRSAARAVLWSNRAAVDCCDIFLWQTRRSTVADVIAVIAEKQY